MYKMVQKIYFPDLYVEKSESVIARLNILGIPEKEFTKKNKINIKKLDLREEEMWDFLNGLQLKGKSGRAITFKKNITSQIAQLLGFIITDGSLISTEPRVSLGQNDEGLLLKYLNIINTEYNINLNFNFNGKETRIISSPLRYILYKYYKIPLGKKVRTVEIPPQILSSDNSDLLRHFIAGLFDGDGYLQYYYLKNKPILDQACFCISTSSHQLIIQAVKLLKKLGVQCSISKRNDGRLTLQTAGFLNTLKFYEHIISLIFHKERKEISNKIILGEDFIGKFTVPLNPDLKNLFKEIRNRKLDKELLDIAIKYKYVRSLRSIESWTYPSKNGKVRSIYIYKACDLLNKDPKNYIPLDQINLIENALK